MALPEPPLWCRIILTIITICSFLPQILRIQNTHSIQGISPFYILWNLISATEQFTIFFFGLINQWDPDGAIFLHAPPSKGDWYSLCHCGIATVLFLVLFVQVLIHSDRRVLLGSSYTSYLLVSVIPLFIDAVSPIDDPQGLLAGIFFALHFIILWPVITILGCLSIYHQAREIAIAPFPNSLSLHGLLLQAIVFLLVSVAWVWCLPFPYEEARGHWTGGAFSAWYSSVGWIIVDNFIFAFGQALLFVLARRCASSDNDITRRGEMEPLLA